MALLLLYQAAPRNEQHSVYLYTWLGYLVAILS